MREIKFRALDKKRKKMYYEGFAIKANTGSSLISWEDYDKDGYEITKWSHCGGEKTIDVIMQFTGLHDKNWREIYEGDIVKFEGHPYPNGKFEEIIINEIQFEGGVFGRRDKNGMLYLLLDKECAQREVIGNIYENPELLEAE